MMRFGLKCWLTGVVLAMTPLALHSATAQEYVPGAGYIAEDEWYDPGDWFDGNDIEIEDYYAGDADAYADYDDYYEDDYYDDDDYYEDDYYDGSSSDYGYGLDDGYDFDDYGSDDGYGYDNYYTNDWYDDGGMFDSWYDTY